MSPSRRALSLLELTLFHLSMYRVSIVDWPGSNGRYLSDVGFGSGPTSPSAHFAFPTFRERRETESTSCLILQYSVTRWKRSLLDPLNRCLQSLPTRFDSLRLYLSPSRSSSDVDGISKSLRRRIETVRTEVHLHPSIRFPTHFDYSPRRQSDESLPVNLPRSSILQAVRGNSALLERRTFDSVLPRGKC